MAAIRPVVFVFQEFATLTVTPTTPDLNCLVVGPAYHIQDYYTPGTTDYEDKDDILLSSVYGSFEAAVGTALPTGDDVIVATNPPNNITGAVLDGDSVVVYFDEARVVITSGVLGTTSASTPSTFIVDDVVDFTTGNDKVLPGDRVILKESSGGTNKIVRTVYAVDGIKTLRFTEDIPATGWTPGGAHLWRIERQVNDAIIDASFYDVNGNAIHINGSITLTVSGQGAKFVSYAKAYVQYRSLRQDLQELNTVASTDEITANIGRLDERNPLAVGVFVARQNTTTPVQYVGVPTDDLVGYTAIRDDIASRTDIYAIVPLTDDPLVIAMWNTDCVGLALPDEVHGRPQKFRVVIGTGTLPLVKNITDPAIAGEAVVETGSAPTTSSRLIIPGATLVVNAVVPGDILTISEDDAGSGTPTTFSLNGNYTVSAVISETVVDIVGTFTGVRTLDTGAKFAVTGPGGSPVRRAASTATSAASTVATINKLTIPGATLVANNVIPGDILTVALDAAGTPADPVLNGTYTIAQVLSDTELQIDGAFKGKAKTLDVLATYGIASPTGAVRRTAAVGTSAGTTATCPDLYLILKDLTATFITSGVIPTDRIQIPVNPSSTDFTNVVSYVVEEVLSNNRLLVVNDGPNTSTLETELPHGVKRIGGALVDIDALHYQVVRTLSKDGQATQLVALAQSFNSRRTVLAWPDVVDVGGVVNGSGQPGYYLACAIGGMTAGLPSHQGFTYLGIAGISRIYHSNTYFSDSQLTDISNGGWYVFAQQTPTTLPYTIHQLTTDPSTLESGEFSVVKNYDFVSLFFTDILSVFLGTYNVNNDTLTLIRQALEIGGETLLLRTYAKIGSPLTAFSIIDLGVSPIYGDRVVTHLSIGLPKPLNNIELHLVA